MYHRGISHIRRLTPSITTQQTYVCMNVWVHIHTLPLFFPILFTVQPSNPFKGILATYFMIFSFNISYTLPEWEMSKNDRPVLSARMLTEQETWNVLSICGWPFSVSWTDPWGILRSYVDNFLQRYNIRLLVQGLRWKAFECLFSDFSNSFTEPESSCYWAAIQMYDQSIGGYYMARDCAHLGGYMGFGTVRKYLKYVL